MKETLEMIMCISVTICVVFAALFVVTLFGRMIYFLLTKEARTDRHPKKPKLDITPVGQKGKQNV